MKISINLLRQAIKSNLTKEIYSLILAKRSFSKAGWISKDDLIRLFLSQCKTKATATRRINRLVEVGWLKYSNGNYHHRAIWRIMDDLGVGGGMQMCATVAESHLRSAKDFKSFCFDVHVAKEIRENWRRRYDSRYRVATTRTNQGKTKYKVDPKSYSQSLGNELGMWTKTCGEYSLRLAAQGLKISLAEAGRLAKFSEAKGETKRTQLFDPGFDELKMQSWEEVSNFIRYREDPSIHGRRIVKLKGWEFFRMKGNCLVEHFLEFTRKRYYSI